MYRERGRYKVERGRYKEEIALIVRYKVEMGRYNVYRWEDTR